MSLRYYLNLAVNKEKASIELYKDLLKAYQKMGGLDKQTKDLFTFLIGEEGKHKRLMEKKLRNLPRLEKKLKKRKNKK